MSQSIDLSPIIREVGKQVDSLGRHLDSKISDVQVQVGSVSSDLQSTRAELQELRTQFGEFLQRHERQRLVQLAETRLGTIKADLEREYGHYGVVRRTSVGILQAFDIGNVRNRTVHEVSEELMIQTPKYWLAPALVALAAWSKDDEDLAEKSVAAAFARDPKKTSLFFALVLRRQARLGEATRWLRHYFLSLDPRSLTREFAVLLEATAQDGFGTDGRQLVLERLDEWREILRDEPDIVTAQVQKWRGEIQNHRGSVDDSTFKFLAHGSPQWPQIKSALEHASAHQFVIDKYTGVRDTPGSLSLSVADRLDDLLEILVSEFDTEELPLRRDVLFQEAIIEHDGDAVRAKQQAELDVAALDETIDSLSLQTHTAFRPDLFGVSVATQKVAVGASAEDFTAAVGQFTRDYRGRWLDQIDITLDESHSNYASTYGFGEWTTSTATPQEQAETSLATHWDAVVQRYIDGQAFGLGKVVLHLLAGVVGVVLGGVLIASAPIVGLVVLLGTLIVVGFLIHQKKQKADALVAAATAAREKAKVVSIDAYRGVSAEWVDARIVYEEEDEKEADLLALVEGWPH
ncbi:MAG: hypothetical protein ABWX74_20995 [Aeromicrobium sp.]